MRSIGRAAVTLAAAAVVLVVGGPAMAAVTGNCTGSATIDGITYDASYDTAARPIVVPEDRAGMVIPYEGSVGFKNTNYLGAVGVVIGPATITVADWGFEENPDDIRATSPGATYVLGSQLDGVVGLYELTAFHDADGGNCDANAMVKFEGSPLGSPIGQGALALAAVSGGLVLAAGRKRA